VNISGVDRARWRELRGALFLARQSAAIGRAMLADRGSLAVEQLTLHVGRQFGGAEGLLASAAAEGLLAAIMGDDRINLINARARATERGIAIATVPALTGEDANVIRATIAGDERQMTIGGVAVPGAAPRLTRIGEFKVDVAPRRTLIVLTNDDAADAKGMANRILDRLLASGHAGH